MDYPLKIVEDSTNLVLQELQMLNEDNQISTLGKKALTLGLHPRLLLWY